jgi:DNA recombination protein RmuC
MDSLSLLAGLITGVLLGATAARLSLRARSGEDLAALQARFEALQAQAAADHSRLQGELEATHDQATRAVLAERERAVLELAGERERAAARLAEEQARADRLLTEERARGAADLAAQAEGHRAALGQLEQVRAELASRFEVLAQQVLEQRSQALAQQNQTSLQSLLQPLSLQIGDFKAKVEEVYRTEGLQRNELATQVKQLMDLNQQLSARAGDLTRALTADNKIQGNWGELVLERILEASGLREGHEYETQKSHQREDGSRVQPDVVVKLPGGRHLIIDSKVSLSAYVEYANLASELERSGALKRHLDSVRTHIKGLSGKRYEDLHGNRSLDFVIMFVPVEPAYLLAISEDAQLWQDAWERNVLLVSPSTLLFVVRTVANLWRQEQQTQNAQDIARRGGELYDKFVGFVEALETVGGRLQQAQKAYEDAHKRLTSGRGSLVRQTEMLRELGVKPAKRIAEGLLDPNQDVDLLPIGPSADEAPAI